MIRELRAAGLDSIPGGGGEILVRRVRERVAKKKARTDEWLEVMEEAHRQGMKTSVDDDVRHRRDATPSGSSTCSGCASVQARTGGFTAFICWPLQPESTPRWPTRPRPTR